jgi:hypothetical protein
MRSGRGAEHSHGLPEVYVAYATTYLSPRLKPSARKEQDAIVVRCVLATQTALLETVTDRPRIGDSIVNYVHISLVRL